MSLRGAAARVRRQLRGGPAAAWTAAFFALGLILAAIEFSTVQWTGTAVQGVERDGIVYYTYRGQLHSIDDTSSFNTHTVYFDPSDPDTSAQLGNGVREAVDVTIVAVPFLIGLTIVGFAVRNRAIARRLSPKSGTFGHGMDPDALHRLNVARRQANLPNATGHGSATPPPDAPATH